MQKTFKQVRITFTTLSLVILFCISFILFIAQSALAQSDAMTPQAAESRADTPERVQEARSATAATNTPAATRAHDAANLRSRVQAAQEFHDLFETLRAEHTQLREERRAELAARGSAHVPALPEQAQNRVTNLTANMTTNLGRTVTRLENISERLRNHTETVAAQNAETEAVYTSLNTVDQLLADATLALEEMDMDVEYVVTSDVPRNDWSIVREQFVAIRDLVHEAREVLREAAATLKATAAETE